MATAYDIIRTALKKLGAVSPTDDLDASEGEDGLADLNRMLNSWSKDELMVYVLAEEDLTLTAGKNEYTIGSGGEFNTVRPVAVDASSYLADSGGYRYPLRIIPREQHNIQVYAVSARPDRVAYSPAYPLGLISFICNPDQAYTFHLVSQKPFTAFTGLFDAVTFPEGYEEALIYNLALRLAPDYEKDPSALVVAMAQASKRNIETIRSMVADVLSVLPAGNGQNGNILTFR